MSCGIYQLSELLKNIVFKDEHMSNKAMDGEFDKYFLKTPRRVSREEYLLHFKIRFTNHPTRVWWSQAGSNRRPPACKAGALPAELWPLITSPFAFILRCTRSSFGHVRSCTLPPHRSCALSKDKMLVLSIPAK